MSQEANEEEQIKKRKMHLKSFIFECKREREREMESYMQSDVRQETQKNKKKKKVNDFDLANTFLFKSDLL